VALVANDMVTVPWWLFHGMVYRDGAAKADKWKSKMNFDGHSAAQGQKTKNHLK